MNSGLAKISKHINPTSFLDYRDYLRTIYLTAKRELGRYTYQKFATDLGFTENNFLHHVISGRRPLTLKSAKQIIQALGLVSIERKYFEALTQYINARKSTDKEKLFEKLLYYKEKKLIKGKDRESLKYFSKWYNIIIGELCAISGMDTSPESIAKALIPPIKPDEVRKSLEILEKLKIIERADESKNFTRTAKVTSTTDETQGISTTRYHRQMIEHGKESLSRVSAREREISSVTVKVSQKTAQKMKAMIQNFEQLLLAEEESTDTADRIYQFNVQFFPFTKLFKKEE